MKFTQPLPVDVVLLSDVMEVDFKSRRSVFSACASAAAPADPFCFLARIFASCTRRTASFRRHALCTWIAAYRCLTWSSSPKGFENSDSSSSLITEPTDPRRLRLGGSGGGSMPSSLAASALSTELKCTFPSSIRTLHVNSVRIKAFLIIALGRFFTPSGAESRRSSFGNLSAGM